MNRLKNVRQEAPWCLTDTFQISSRLNICSCRGLCRGVAANERSRPGLMGNMGERSPVLYCISCIFNTDQSCCCTSEHVSGAGGFWTARRADFFKCWTVALSPAPISLRYCSHHEFEACPSPSLCFVSIRWTSGKLLANSIQVASRQQVVLWEQYSELETLKVL